MKTYLTYGFAMALGGALLTLVLYFLGFHSDAAKLNVAQWIGSCGLLVIGVTCTVLGTKARRAEIPATEDFGYGRALGTGVMIALFSALFSIVTNYVYFQFINPGLVDLIVQARIDKMEASGMSSEQLERVEKGIRMFMSPVFSACIVFINAMVWGTLISLVTSIFLKRPSSEDPLVAGS